MRGWPTVAIVDREDKGELKDREAVCKMCVWGIDTVIIIRRGGFGDGGRVAH
jgi:hypothetical protein